MLPHRFEHEHRGTVHNSTYYIIMGKKGEERKGKDGTGNTHCMDGCL
jgi:hypothetical protein